MNRFLFSVSFLLLAVGSLIYVENQAHAQAVSLVKPFTGKINKAVASSIGKRLNTLGFAANDPIYTGTLTAAETVVGGAVAAGSVAATVASIGTAPVWVSVALGLGAAYEIYDWSMGAWDWKADASLQKVTLAQGTIFRAPPLPAPVPGYDWTVAPSAALMPHDYADPGVGVAVVYPSDQKICASTTGKNAAGSNVSFVYCGNTPAELEAQVHWRYMFSFNYAYQQVAPSGGYFTNFVDGVHSGPTKQTCTVSATCPDGFSYAYSIYHQYYFCNAGQVMPNCSVQPGVSETWSVFNNKFYVNTTTPYSLNDAAAKLADTDLNTYADNELLAALANKIWQRAAQEPGYQGAPYDVNNPITGADIEADIAAGLYPRPTVADLLSLVKPTTATAPTLDPNAQPVENTAPSTSASVDLGPDPGIAQPALETAPTGSAVVDYVMGLMPSFASFTLPAHTGTCEMPVFDFFGHQMSMAGACDLIESQRAVLSTLFSAIWGVSALFVVLRA